MVKTFSINYSLMVSWIMYRNLGHIIVLLDSHPPFSVGRRNFNYSPGIKYYAVAIDPAAGRPLPTL